MKLPNKKNFLNIFYSCISWEEKYIYIIELGRYLNKIPKFIKIDKYLVHGCQSQVWLFMYLNNEQKVKFYGDSDSSIVKGLIAIIFILYENLKINEIINVNVAEFLNSIQLTQHLTKSRSNGINAIINKIHMYVLLYSKKN
ncbi:MAG: cysteine desulfuration protein SufE [Enterobacterales bacterium]